jgi:hypothetical protein
VFFKEKREDEVVEVPAGNSEGTEGIVVQCIDNLEQQFVRKV